MLPLLLIFCLVFTAQATQPTLPACYDRMLEAARRQNEAQQAIYEYKLAKGLFNADDDSNRTGMIGVEYSELTTTLGSLPSKRTSANPDFAAYIVRVLSEHGITADDTVLVTMTGSFPAMNLAVVIALDVLGIPSLRMASLGASSYGANQPEFTWIDMEDLLVRARLLSRRSDFVSLGGTGDVGRGMDDNLKYHLRGRARRLGYTLLEAPSFRKQTQLRREIIGDPKRYHLLINIGGNHAAIGGNLKGRELPGGWISPTDSVWHSANSKSGGGELVEFLSAGIPVLELLHVTEIAEQAGIPVDPRPLPEIGTSPLFLLR